MQPRESLPKNPTQKSEIKPYQRALQIQTVGRLLRQSKGNTHHWDHWGVNSYTAIHQLEFDTILEGFHHSFGLKFVCPGQFLLGGSASLHQEVSKGLDLWVISYDLHRFH